MTPFVSIEVTDDQLPNLLNVLEDMADRGEVVGYGEECDCGYPIKAGWNWCGESPCRVLDSLVARDQPSEGEPLNDS